MATSSYHFQHYGIKQHDLTHEKNTQSVSQQWLFSKRTLAEKKCVQSVTAATVLVCSTGNIASLVKLQDRI